ncbi:2-oxoacid:ferredoxin oxidoreductase subunit gamma [Methanobacterium petrolearium]|uniref:2-oxoacid:ferredoxin oxidoreductase subunit gamma n=1 Tax=Methanobacterium petrolearium TaxID=710190 RepID=UPI001AE506F5|nr:2-oxoacid:ferredoxin oxidoreductase subunit gamma [Methanobacterium petrolearium]MBP1945072.1 2-oxoglutarate ferredoxin oxidoreductase subunit gamma [Methanobacterium petrolearium]BDZ70404.1 2-oxoglutarate ferredoxin oxidoreductase subunit gamma [Methanobacterium petrolearium]
MRKEVRIAGFGGQGIILAGIVIGKAAALYDGLQAVQTQSYGPEARGGASRTEVVISDEEIDYPKVQHPDIFVAMSHEALLAYLKGLKPGGILIIDPDLVMEDEISSFITEHNIQVHHAPATRTADEKVGLRIVANIVMIGAITGFTGIISEEAARKAIAASVPPGTEDKNLSAFEAGIELSREEA